MLTPLTLLSLIVLLPAAAAFLLLLIQPLFLRNDAAIKTFTLAVMAVTCALSLILLLQPSGGMQVGFSLAPDQVDQMQNVFFIPWIKPINVDYAMGVDGISLPLVVLTTVVGLLSMGASWTINKNVKAYFALFLTLQTGILGVFLSLDFFLFYIFWEVMLVPMYFLIGIWGGPRRLYASFKFFLFTLAGGVAMLIAILMLYFTSDLTGLTTQQRADSHVLDPYLAKVSPNLPAVVRIKEADAQFLAAIKSGEAKRHTYNILALQQIGQNTDQFNKEFFAGKSVGWWAFLLLLLGFIVKVPSVPVHVWLPDAHVEAPTPISMILAGVLLKLGGYGIIRMCYPICPEAGFSLDWLVCGLGIVSMLYGALAAMAAKDFKRLVAYSSVSHMGYVMLGIGAWGATKDWAFGMNGAMFQMIAHGISSTGMFFIVGVLYDRVHHRDLDKFGGVLQKMPGYGALAFGIFFAGMGLPGLCGFIGEVMVVLGAWPYNQTLAVLAALVVLLTAGYILWTLQRVFFGADYKGPHGEGFAPMTVREKLIGGPILALAILFGVVPGAIFHYMKPAVNRLVEDLQAKRPPLEPKKPTAVVATSANDR